MTDPELEDMPPDPAPNIMLISGFTLEGTWDDGTPFTETASPAILYITPLEVDG
jgi:hypothetical protein